MFFVILAVFFVVSVMLLMTEIDWTENSFMSIACVVITVIICFFGQGCGQGIIPIGEQAVLLPGEECVINAASSISYHDIIQAARGCAEAHDHASSEVTPTSYTYLPGIACYLPAGSNVSKDKMIQMGKLCAQAHVAEFPVR